MYQLRRVLFLGVLNMLAAFITFGCLNDELSPEAAERQGFDNFKTAVAIPDRNYDIYWMGREFEAGGLTYKGPDVADFADEVEGGGLGLHYLAEIGTVCCIDLHVILYSRDGWEIVQQKRSQAPRPQSTTRQVRVSGRVATLRTNVSTIYPVAAQILIVDFGDTIVEASTGAVTPETPSPVQPNPLVDEATFLAAMENLRPYPE